MILAAGLGTRMHPLTTHIAKPVLPIVDEPIVLGLVRALATQGVDRIVINTHAHAESVRAALRDPPTTVLFSHEPALRGSGGGIQAARDWLDIGEPFLVVNGDMRVELDLPALLRVHREVGGAATVLLRDDPRKEIYGTLGYDHEARICRITTLAKRARERGSGLFAGVHVFEPDIFARMPSRTTFDIVQDVYVPMVQEGVPIGAALQAGGARWSPLGTPAEFLEANLETLHERQGGRVQVEGGRALEGELTGPAWIGPEAIIERDAHVGPDVVIGARAEVKRGAHVERAVVLPGARVPKDARVRDAVVSQGGVWTRG